MQIKAIAPWYGSKRTLAPRIVAELGVHRCYWEPFCGSMAVLMAKAPCSMETVNDLHGDLVNLARVIQHPVEGPRFYRMLRRAWLCDALHQEAATHLRTSPAGGAVAVRRAYNYFLVSWLGRNGVAGSGSYNSGFCVRYTNKGGHAARRFASAVDSIPAWRRRMREVTILSRDALELLARIEDAPCTAVYCDPPYVLKGASYVHDFEREDHRELAQALMRFKRARVVVSYYDHPLVRELYAPENGWTRVAAPTTKAMVNQGRRNQGGAVQAPEVLMINGPSYTQTEGTLWT